MHNEPTQPIRRQEFQLVVRTFIPFKTYLGFMGDNRTFSASPSDEFRTGMFLVFNWMNGKITTPLAGKSSGTSRSATGARYYAKVHVRLKRFEGYEGKVSI